MGDSVKYWAVIVPPRWRVVAAEDKPPAPADGYVIEVARCGSVESARRVVREVADFIRVLPAVDLWDSLDYLRAVESHLLHGYGDR